MLLPSLPNPLSARQAAGTLPSAERPHAVLTVGLLFPAAASHKDRRVLQQTLSLGTFLLFSQKSMLKLMKKEKLPVIKIIMETCSAAGGYSQ